MVLVNEVHFSKQLVTIPIDGLAEDVPVDDAHVRELMEMLRLHGQVEPLLIWEETRRVIDGFHRLRAMKLLNWKEATFIAYSCTEETFWRMRIVSAVTHRTVRFARLVEWVKAAFRQTKWGQKLDVEKAWSFGRKGASLRSFNFNREERQELADWVQARSKQWGLKPATIANMLRIDKLAVPGLVSQVRDDRTPGHLSVVMVEEIATKLPRSDIQLAVAQKVQAEKLTGSDVQTLVERVAKGSEEERERLLHTSFRRVSKGRTTQSAAKGLHELRTERITDSLNQLILILPELSRPQPFDDLLVQGSAAIGIYLEGEEVPALTILQQENRRLKKDTRKLTEDIERKDLDLKAQRRTIGVMQEEIDQLRRR